MALKPKRIGALVLRLIALLSLLGSPRLVSAEGTWSVISLPQQPGEVLGPSAVAVDAADNLYVADSPDSGARIQQRDAQGNWTVLATVGSAPGQVGSVSALAVGSAGSLYVADGGNGWRIQKRDGQGNWSLIATTGAALGQVHPPRALAVDPSGNLYVADGGGDGGNAPRIQKRDTQGNWSMLATGLYNALAVDTAGNLYAANGGGIQKRNTQGSWSVIATQGDGLGQFGSVNGLAVDASGNLYAADNTGTPRIQKRDAQGNWSVLATGGVGVGQVGYVSSLAVDAAGSLYVADSRIQKRDTQGNWSVVAPAGDSPGHVKGPGRVAVDGAGNLYVADYRDHFGSGDVFERIQKRDAQGNWSLVGTSHWHLTALAVDSASNLYVVTPAADYGWLGLPSALAVDAAGNLYFAGSYAGIQQRDAQGNWSVIATSGTALGQVSGPTALAVDGAGNLYVAERHYDPATGDFSRVQKRDAQGNWSVIALLGSAPGQVGSPTALAVDTASNLYVAEGISSGIGNNRIQKRDAQGHWSVIAALGAAIGQVANPEGLAVDAAGHLYVADTDNNRVQMHTP
jgi:sugar lactone lactonase YvrE